jgi:hypothetical protein
VIETLTEEQKLAIIREHRNAKMREWYHKNKKHRSEYMKEWNRKRRASKTESVAALAIEE